MDSRGKTRSSDRIVLMETAYTLLVIEDDQAVGRSLKAGLEREGFNVIWQSSGEQGIACAIERKPHLILLDIRLPDGSGFDFCRRMRQAGLVQPILIVTVQREEMDKVIGLEIGADDYITKPFGLRELVSRVRAHLRRAYGEYALQQSDLIFIRDLVIDQVRLQVKRDGQQLNLTPIEFKLLTYLARHPQQVLSRARIVEEVWGFDADGDSERNIKVHIRRLREKIEPDPTHPAIILTVPGIGYRLVN